MFLAERIFGIAVYTSLLLITCYLIYRSQPIFTKKILIFYLLGISLVAFFYVPAIEADLYRLIEYMHNYTAMPYNDFVELVISPENAATPITLIYFRLLGLTGINGLLAATTALIVFSNIFYIVYNYGKRLPASNKAIAFGLFTVMSTGIYMSTISGIRSSLALSIVARCIYVETVNSTPTVKNFIWYALAALIHPAAIAAITLWITYRLYSKINTKNIKPFISMLVNVLIPIFGLFYFGLINYFYNAVDLFNKYYTGVDYTYIWDNIMTAFIMLFIILNYWIYHQTKNKVAIRALSDIVKFSYLLSIVSIIFVFEISIFARFTQLNLIVMLPVIINNFSNAFNQYTMNNKKLNMAYRFITMLPILIFVISATRGALSSLKFFILG